MASMIDNAKVKLHDRFEQKHAPANEAQNQGAQPTASDPTPSTEQGHEAAQHSDHQPAAGDEDDAAKSVEVHNKARSAKNLIHLSWDESLAQQATAYAEELAKKGRMQHSRTKGQGENLFMSTGDASFSDAVQCWLAEEKDYKGEKIGVGDFAKWGHYSQCMWHSTTKVGLGKAKSSLGATFIVGRYTPPGNMAGQKPFDP